MRSMFRVAFAILLVVVAVGMIASASASALVFTHWGNEKGEVFKTGEKINVTSSNKEFGTEFTIDAEMPGGIPVPILCKGEQGKGWLENPAGGGNGRGVTDMELTNCTFTRSSEASCEIVGGKLPFQASTEVLLNSEGIPKNHYTPENGNTFLEMTIERCKEPTGLNGKWTVKGTYTNVFNFADATVTFYPTPELKIFGDSASLSGEMKEEQEGGGHLEVRTVATTIARTEPVSTDRETEVTLAGTVNPEGSETAYHFEYGTTKSYGHSAPVPSKSVGKGTENVKVTNAISGLTAGTEYHYRVVAETDGIDVYGADRTFTTPDAYWSVCKKVESGGIYTNNACSEQGSPFSYAWTQTASGVKSNTTSIGGSLVLKGEVSVKEVTLECKKEEGTGSIENPMGGGAGKGVAEAKLKECSLTQPTGNGCKTREPIEFKANAELVSQEGAVEDKLTPIGGSFAEVTFEGCTITVLNGKYPLKGTEYGILTNSTLEFTKATSSKLKFAGNPATLEGTSKQAVEGGGAIQLG